MSSGHCPCATDLGCGGLTALSPSPFGRGNKFKAPASLRSNCRPHSKYAPNETANHPFACVWRHRRRNRRGANAPSAASAETSGATTSSARFGGQVLRLSAFFGQTQESRVQRLSQNSDDLDCEPRVSRRRRFSRSRCVRPLPPAAVLYPPGDKRHGPFDLHGLSSARGATRRSPVCFRQAEWR